MSKVKCFDVVSMVIDEATNQFGPMMKRNEESYKILKQYCIAFDTLAEDFDGISFDVEVDDIKMTIAIAMECPSIEVTEHNHIFTQLAKRADEVSFKCVDENSIEVCFVFPSIWESAV